MNIFRKWFGGPSKKADESKLAQWDAVLNECDLLMAREAIVDMHKMANAEAEKAGGAYYWCPEYVAAWEAFRDGPTIDTARALLDVSPTLLGFFEMYCPGGSGYFASRYLKEHGLR